MLTATGLMYNPVIAAKSKIPWILFLTGNCTWLIDSYITHNIQWVVLSVLFMAFDGALLIQRIRNKNVIT